MLFKYSAFVFAKFYRSDRTIKTSYNLSAQHSDSLYRLVITTDLGSAAQSFIWEEECWSYCFFGGWYSTWSLGQLHLSRCRWKRFQRLSAQSCRYERHNNATRLRNVQRTLGHRTISLFLERRKIIRNLVRTAIIIHSPNYQTIRMHHMINCGNYFSSCTKRMRVKTSGGLNQVLLLVQNFHQDKADICNM